MRLDALLHVVLLSIVPLVLGHGRLIEPPSRASAWRYGFDTPHNYNDHELYCGGFTRQWVKNGGKCGICGDAWDMKTPRPHDYGGTYGKGVLVRKYTAGSTTTLRVELTANHNGYFEFSVCPNYKSPTQNCFDKNLLKLAKMQEDVEHLGYRYYPKDGNKVYEMKYRMPKRTCNHCVLQWRYIAGNNWGNCPNGTGAVGCGPQEEFRACADISITGRGSEEPMLPSAEEPIMTTSDVVPTAPVPIPPGESYSPFSTLVVSLLSFLVVFSVFFLLYFHFYQTGEKIKKWIGGRKHQNTLKVAIKNGGLAAPQPPPRAKKGNKGAEQNNYSMNNVV